MGKPSKKSAVAVAVAPAAAPAAKGKAGKKREAGDEIEKAVSAKKQKAAPPSKEDGKKSKKQPPAQEGREQQQLRRELVGVRGRETCCSSEETICDCDSEDESDDEESPQKKPKEDTPSTDAKKESSSDDEDDASEESSDDEPILGQQKKAQQKSESSDSDESSEESDEEDEKLAKTPKKVVPAATKSHNEEPKTPASNQSQETGSTTLFMGNLSFNVDYEQVKEFFKEVAEVVFVRLATHEDGTPRGFGHVQFASAEDAKKALELKGKDFMGRAVKLDIARERGAQTPNSRNDTGSFQKQNRGSSQSVFIKGFDSSLEESEIRESLQGHFAECGEISRLSVPMDRESGASRGIAYIDFVEQASLSKALELNGSDLGGYNLYVDEAKPKGDSRDGGFRGGGRSSGGRSGVAVAEEVGTFKAGRHSVQERRHPSEMTEELILLCCKRDVSVRRDHRTATLLK
ncbi:hypothetical protein GUJ93_ZPchr0010g8792 [Zizania palustris]|uniref:RRM domain-containing protein n=1 Tax=Zizania palustris TaxID=103762 RepID=A0A8J6BKH8_ZIZPA|nr:hypothetical protein GUJ93_ZPchr0010g8792 [Zizania palustris]